MNFYTNNNWEGGERIPPDLIKLDDIGGWIKKLLMRLKEIGSIYSKYLINDNELIGQEKASLAGRIKELVGAFMLFRQYVTEPHPVRFSSLPNEYEYCFSVSIIAGKWTGKGKMVQTGVYRNDSFLDWYNSMMIQKTRDLFQLYAKASADGVISVKEREDIILFIENMINEMLVMQHTLLYSKMKN